MRQWLEGSGPGGFPYVQGERDLQQALTDKARQDAIAAMVAATYPGVVPQFGSQPEPTLPAWIVRAALTPGPITRATQSPVAGADGAVFIRVELSISNSPLALTFTVDPQMGEGDFRALVRRQYALIAESA